MIGVVLVRYDLTHHTSVIYLLPTAVTIFSNFMTWKVSVPLTCCFFAPLVPLTTPWQSLPSLFEYDVLPTSLYFGWRQSWIYFSDSPVSFSKTGIDVCSSGLGVHHKLISLVEYFLCASITGLYLKTCWVVRYLVQWATGCSITVAGSNFLDPIGSAGVGQLADNLLGYPQLKWVAPFKVPAPLEPAASLVLLLEPLKLNFYVLKGSDAVGQLWPYMLLYCLPSAQWYPGGP